MVDSSTLQRAPRVIVMRTEITLEPGDRLRFEPGIVAITSEPGEWQNFCQKRQGQGCTLIEVKDIPEPTSMMEELKAFTKGDRLIVQFDDGFKKEIGSRFLVVLSKK